MDGLLAGNAEALETLPIEKRAMIPDGLPHEISIKDIATLAYPDDTTKQEALIKALVDSCKTGELQYYGDINGWSYQEDMLNPFPKVKGGYCMVQIWDGRAQMLYADSGDCLVHQDDFKSYLQSKKQWPVNGLLANWWKESETEHRKTREKHESTVADLNNIVDFGDDFFDHLEVKQQEIIDEFIKDSRARTAKPQAEVIGDAGEVVKSAKPDNEKEFNLRLAALRRWMISKGLEQDDDKPIKLKHYPQFKDYTKATIYAELCGFDNAFLIAEATFYDFWQEQKLLKFK